MKSFVFEAIGKSVSCCYRQFLFIVTIAIALGEDELVIDHNTHANADTVPLLHRLFHESVEALEFLRDVGAFVLSADGYGESENEYKR